MAPAPEQTSILFGSKWTIRPSNMISRSGARGKLLRARPMTAARSARLACHNRDRRLELDSQRLQEPSFPPQVPAPAKTFMPHQHRHDRSRRTGNDWRKWVFGHRADTCRALEPALSTVLGQRHTTPAQADACTARGARRGEYASCKGSFPSPAE